MKFSLLRFTNLVLLILLALLGFTGAYSLFWAWAPWMFDLHRLAGILLVAAIPWKVGISWASLKRGLRADWNRGAVVLASLFLAIAAIVVIVLGFAWYWQLGPEAAWLRQTVIAWHWMIGLGLAVPLIFHVWQRWPKPRQVDFLSRRAFLRLAALSAAGLAGWRATDAIARQRSLAGAGRRYTGSRAAPSYAGNQYPVTNNPGEGITPLNVDEWRLRVDGEGLPVREITYPELSVFPASEISATIDCTLGWYSVHRWRGLAIRDLIPLGTDSALHGYGILLASDSGYTHVIPFPEAKDILLATHVDGQPLDQWHGYPLRAVVPSRRGWHWVKWLRRVTLVEVVV